jgi:hypothetical protein
MNTTLKIRKAQLIMGYGPGSIISDVDGLNYLILAKRHWNSSIDRRMKFVKDEFLRSKLKVGKLTTIKSARNTRDFQSDIKAIRIPQWHYCAYCYRMYKVDYLNPRLPKCSNSDCNSSRRRKSTLTPTRLLVVCKKGHLSDFPFDEYVHGSKEYSSHELLYKIDNRKTGLSGVIIQCINCDKKKSLEGVLSSEGLLKRGIGCSGDSPWLLDQQRKIVTENCSEVAQAVQKSSSNIYFPLIVSSIYIPPIKLGFDQVVIDFFESEQAQIVKAVASTDARFTDDKIWDIACKISHTLNGYSNNQQIKNDFLAYYNCPPDDLECSFKENEYEAFTSGLSYAGNLDFQILKRDRSLYSDSIPNYLDEVILLKKIKVTRAFCGFTRILPADEMGSSLSREQKIIEAYGSMNEVIVDEVRGEGMLLIFSEDKINEWIASRDVINEFNRLPTAVKNDLKEKFEQPPKFMLLHSFAHALISEISTVSGYSTSSMAERIYVNNLNEKKMSGLMIYTADADGEGSLGGLVRLGEPLNLNLIFRNAINKNSWCSSDPICSEYGIQGSTMSNLAACHNCLILPETSCEYFNQYLNRRYLNTENYTDSIGFFKK